jgi:hypothetical protein
MPRREDTDPGRSAAPMAVTPAPEGGPRGLASGEVEKLRARHGWNEIEAPPSPLAVLVRQFTRPGSQRSSARRWTPSPSVRSSS